MRRAAIAVLGYLAGILVLVGAGFFYAEGGGLAVVVYAFGVAIVVGLMIASRHRR